MKFTVSLALALFFLGQDAVQAQKACNSGTLNPCPKGQVCVVQAGSLPGAPGVCGKKCNAGTANFCPKGQHCYTTSTMPGAAGGCISDSSCFEQKEENSKLQDFLVDQVVNTYSNFLVAPYQGLFQQVTVKSPAKCGGAPFVGCGDDQFCLIDPVSTDPAATGKCFNGTASEFGICTSGTEYACQREMTCFTPPNSPPGAQGRCFPAGSKTCMTGTQKPCATGYQCVALVPGLEGGPGICVAADMCYDAQLASDEMMYWHFTYTRQTYSYDLDDAHKNAVKQKLGF